MTNRWLASGFAFCCPAMATLRFAGECRDGREVAAASKNTQVDLLFLDIQMPGRDGFEIMQQLDPLRMPVTVFVTAHPQFAVRAFDGQALDGAGMFHGYLAIPKCTEPHATNSGAPNFSENVHEMVSQRLPWNQR